MKPVIQLIILISLLTMSNNTINAQTKYPLQKDVSTISGLINATYEVVSGLKGEKRQWERDISLHHPKAIYSYKNNDGSQLTISVSDFHKETQELVIKSDFIEYEINREVKIFGNIAHVWSTYETKFKVDGPVERRGINSIQLIYENERWWIISWVFDKETNENKIPKSYDKN
ncbi:hypothetical protein ACSIGC_06960 [Tenacibaculum sp. ZS6-P6]|uniref:hypothetical protein n=1 Tax=Tenacibaculum sp. ZS6-P6 TaxID=3447503 RepID=UPI003F9E5E3F